MVTKKSVSKSKASKPDFVSLMKQIPVEAFIRMVSKSGLPPQTSRELCQAFKDLK